MSERGVPEAQRGRALIQRMTRRLDGFVRGLGLDKAGTRQIGQRVVADMPVHTDEERLTKARNWLIVASA